jgi:hypothetical protein
LRWSPTATVCIGWTLEAAPHEFEGAALGDALGVDVEPGGEADGVVDAVQADGLGELGTKSSLVPVGLRKVTRVTGSASSSSHGTTVTTPSSGRGRARSP